MATCHVCGYKSNPPDAQKCLVCGTAFNSTVICHQPRLTLRLVDKGSYTDAIEDEEITITADCVIDRLQPIHPLFSCDTISSPHLKITLSKEKFYINDERSTNGTFLNGALVPKNLDIKLCDGHKLTIADLEFSVQIEERHIEVIENDEVQETKQRVFSVTCPLCGVKYIVEDEGVRMKVCKNCGDTLITYEKPKEIL